MTQTPSNIKSQIERGKAQDVLEGFECDIKNSQHNCCLKLEQIKKEFGLS